MEAISQDEVRSVSELVIPRDRVILNGPAKWWPSTEKPQQVRAAFVDSMSELERLRDSPGRWKQVLIHGVRAAPVGVSSRFGVDIGSYPRLEEIAQLLGPVVRSGSGFGVHFHLQPSEVGPARWLEEASAGLEAAAGLAELMGVELAMFDIGGGWHPDDTDAFLGQWLPRLLSRARDLIPDATLVLEPGKLLTGGTAAVVATVLDRRDRSGHVDIVVDASIAELPTAPWSQHPAVVVNNGALVDLQPGFDRIFGRTCMEGDVLSNSLDLCGLNEGDRIAFLNAGSYDRSMQHPFGRGATC